jgi:hypothetical protein
MNDQELGSAVKEAVAGADIPVPVDRIVSRGRVIRARRRVAGAAAAVAVAAGTALAVTALLPSSHQPGQPPRVQLAAWTVARQADGDIAVTIREWRDPSGLQAALRADGLRVVVNPPANRPCQPYPANNEVLNAVIHIQTSRTNARVREESTVLVIDPSAIPNGAGLSISDPRKSRPVPSPQVNRVPPRAQGRAGLQALVSLVETSQQCTGS